MGDTGRPNFIHDAANSAYLYGSFNGTVNFNPGSGVKDFTNIADKSDFVVSLLSNNTLAWAAQTGGAGVGNSERMLAVDRSGNVSASALRPHGRDLHRAWHSDGEVSDSSNSPPSNALVLLVLT